MNECKLWMNGRWQAGKEPMLTVYSPFSGKPLTLSHQASHEQILEAARASEASFHEWKHSSRAIRSLLLSKIAESMLECRKEFVDLLIDEAGKPRTFAEAEFSRALFTCTYAAEETKRMGGSMYPSALDANQPAYEMARSFFVPRGPVLGITPFNFPLNLVMHKLAPALAAGCSIIIKTAPQTPGHTTLLAKIFEKVCDSNPELKKIPKSIFQVLQCSNQNTIALTKQPELQTISFTGSATVGWNIHQTAREKKILLELGGNASVIVCKDADINQAAAKIATAGFAFAGQSCISVQRIWVESAIYPAFAEKLKLETLKLKTGDPTNATTSIGPVISKASVERIESWVDEAVGAGANFFLKGVTNGNLMEPVILEKVPPNCKLHIEEVFGPVVILESFDSLDSAIQKINQSRYAIHAGAFTNDLSMVQKISRELDATGILFNEVPTFRIDQMPYGGIKASGLGREGIRYAMEEFSELKTIIEKTV